MSKTRAVVVDPRLTYAVPGSVLLNLVKQDIKQDKALAFFKVVPDPSAIDGMCRKGCYAQADPAKCCKQKLGMCQDADCKAGTYTGRLPARPAPQPVYIPIPAFSDCKAWNQCSQTFAPAECCRLKPATCYDPACFAGQFVLPSYAPLVSPPTAAATPGVVPPTSVPATMVVATPPATATAPVAAAVAPATPAVAPTVAADVPTAPTPTDTLARLDPAFFAPLIV